MTRRDLFENSAIGFVAVGAIVASVLAAPGFHGMLGAGLGVLMLAISVTDARRFIIPDALTLAALALALVNAGTQGGEETVLGGVLDAALRGALLASLFLILRMIYHRLRQRPGMGLGDVKLAGVAGAWLGWSTIPIAVEIAALAALAVFGLRQFFQGRPLRATQRVPFGLFLAPAIWLCWLLEVALLGP